MKMPTYYDDNFGHWEDVDDPDVQEFYYQVQRESVLFVILVLIFQLISFYFQRTATLRNS
jgi:hypothetical protein